MKVTGIGNSKYMIDKGLRNLGYDSELISYPLEEDIQDDLVFIVYDGLHVEAFSEIQEHLNTRIIPIFVDVDRFIVLGEKKLKHVAGEVCIACVVERFKSSFNSSMHETLFHMKSYSVVDYILPEEFDIFLYQLIQRIEDDQVSGNILNYLLDYHALFNQKVPGYTKCPYCDRNQYDNQGLEMFIRKELV